MHVALKMLASLAIITGIWVFAAVSAIANLPPWFNHIRPTEKLMRATSAHDSILRHRLITLSPTVRADEADRVVSCAYTTGRELAREWRVFWIPGVQNFLVNVGARKGGLCFQWASELLIRLNALKLQTLDLHWAESFAGTSAEHNVIVVTAKGQPFEKGILLDNWRYEGGLLYGGVKTDPEYRWTENPAELARRLKANSAITPSSGPTKEETRRTMER